MALFCSGNNGKMKKAVHILISIMLLGAAVNAQPKPVVAKPPSVRVYPNPAQDILYLDIKGTNAAGIVTIKIMNLEKGSIMEEVESTVDLQFLAVNVSALPRGIYIVKVSTGRGEVSSRFIKE